jgi:hypothetical protein
MILSPSHIRDVYTKSDESNTIKFNKMDVDNKETITDNHYQKLVTKTMLWRINYKNGVTQKRL